MHAYLNDGTANVQESPRLSRAFLGAIRGTILGQES